MKVNFRIFALALLLSGGLLSGCSGILDGPLNKNGVLVPELLNANNGSGYITYWDDETRSYRTYDQVNNIILETVAYSRDQVRDQGRKSADEHRVRRNRNYGHSRNYMITASSVMPMTALSPEEMAIQNKEGCMACHQG